MTDIVERLRSSLQLHGPHLLRNADIAEAACEIERLRFAALAVDEVNARLHAALQNIAIGGNGETNWTASEMRAYAEDALRP